ncbi:MAG: Kynurenine formamidase, bacterial, partial [uncultured Thermomicrobiales bacterium]
GHADRSVPHGRRRVGNLQGVAGAVGLRLSVLRGVARRLCRRHRVRNPAGRTGREHRHLRRFAVSSAPRRGGSRRPAALVGGGSRRGRRRCPAARRTRDRRRGLRGRRGDRPGRAGANRLGYPLANGSVLRRAPVLDPRCGRVAGDRRCRVGRHRLVQHRRHRRLESTGPHDFARGRNPDRRAHDQLWGAAGNGVPVHRRAGQSTGDGHLSGARLRRAGAV